MRNNPKSPERIPTHPAVTLRQRSPLQSRGLRTKDLRMPPTDFPTSAGHGMVAKLAGSRPKNFLLDTAHNHN